jgi:hypothetical protein
MKQVCYICAFSMFYFDFVLKPLSEHIHPQFQGFTFPDHVTVLSSLNGNRLTNTEDAG